MSNKTPLTPSMGGLDALVAAASAAGQVSRGQSGSKRKRGDTQTTEFLDMFHSQLMIQSNHDPNDTNAALISLLTNPIFVSALTATTQSAGVSTPSQPTTTLNTQFPQPNFHQNGSMSNGPPNLTQTSYQQTRSGRISRPPAQPSYNLLQALSAEIDSGSGNFDALLKGLSSSNGNNAMNNGINHGINHVNFNHGEPVIDPALTSTPFNQMENQPSLDGTDLFGINNQWNDNALNSTTGMGDEIREESLTPDMSLELMEGELPAWPLPPGGRGGRKNMPKDEMLARRRARNRVAAIESRRRKKTHMEGLEGRLRERELAYQLLQIHCKKLEQQIEQLQQVITSAGLPVPSSIPSTSTMLPTIPTNANPVPPTPVYGLDGTPMTHSTFDESPLPPLDMFFNVDMDGEDDGEFLPPSSPANESDNEDAKKRRAKGKKRATEEDDDDDFEDEDVEDEDLFLPIEDVPIPPDAQMQAMRSLGVDNNEQLASLINKMVVAGKEGMTSEMVDKLKVLLSLVGPNGGWSKSDK